MNKLDLILNTIGFWICMLLIINLMYVAWESNLNLWVEETCLEIIDFIN